MAQSGYVGKAGQLAAMAEFLLRGYNVAMPEVDVGDDQLLLLGEPLRLGQQVAVLVDQRLPVPGEIGRRLAHTGGGVQIAGDRPRGL